MNKEKIIKILENYEYFVDDDYGGHYENINCSQKALTPLGILNILDYIDELQQRIDKLFSRITLWKMEDITMETARVLDDLLNVLKENGGDGNR